jgi:uncharacterized protein (TIGR02284 family)
MDNVKNETLKMFFKDKVNQRNSFGRELKKEIEQYGHLPDKSGSITGGLHRTWMNLSSTLSANDSERILEEVVRGENASLKQYDEILKDSNLSLPQSTEDLLKRQRNAIQTALDKTNRFEAIVS